MLRKLASQRSQQWQQRFSIFASRTFSLLLVDPRMLGEVAVAPRGDAHQSRTKARHHVDVAESSGLDHLAALSHGNGVPTLTLRAEHTTVELKPGLRPWGNRPASTPPCAWQAAI